MNSNNSFFVGPSDRDELLKEKAERRAEYLAMVSQPIDCTMTEEEEEIQPKQPAPEKYAKYRKDVRHLDSIDVYETHRLYAIDDPSGCIQHASKKLLLSGVRTGGKSKQKDIEEARDTLNRWLEMNDAE